MFTRGMGGGSTEGMTRSRKSEANCLFLNPDSSPVQQMTLDELPNLSTLLFICLQNKNSDVPPS